MSAQNDQFPARGETFWNNVRRKRQLEIDIRNRHIAWSNRGLRGLFDSTWRPSAREVAFDRQQRAELASLQRYFERTRRFGREISNRVRRRDEYIVRRR